MMSFIKRCRAVIFCVILAILWITATSICLTGLVPWWTFFITGFIGGPICTFVTRKVFHLEYCCSVWTLLD